MDLLKSDGEAGQLSRNILKLIKDNTDGLWKQLKYDIQDRSYRDGVSPFVTRKCSYRDVTL